MQRGARRKLCNGIAGGEKISGGGQVGRDVAQGWCFNEENKKLRESVLNKLWDSLPPETQMSSHSEDEDSDSTQSGLGEEEVYSADEELSFKNCSKFPSLKDGRRSAGFTNEENSAQSRFCNEKIADTRISLDTNLGFIQSIIWLKSTTAKLQRIPVDEFVQALKNQWELSPKIQSTKTSSYNSLIKTKQREKVDLIRNRLVTNQDHSSGDNQYDDTLIPETDESENPSLESSQSVPDRPVPICTITQVSELIGNLNYSDSGFGSQKPESAEAISASQCMRENAIKKKERQKENMEFFNSRSRRLTNIPGEGSASGDIDPITEIGSKNQSAGDGKSRKRKYDSAFGSVLETTTRKRPRLSISSATLNYTLRSSECHKGLLSAVQVILKVFENEEGGCYNVAGSNWYDSVKKEAIEAIVSIVDLLEKEKGPNSCRNEVVAMVKRVLEKMLASNEIDKATVWEHHRLVILEFCNAASVCTEVVNYLISELKGCIPVARETTGEVMKASVVAMDKSYILFHALKVVLRKYTSSVRTRVMAADEENTSQNIPEVKDLWKQNWRVSGKRTDIFSTGLERVEIPKDPEKVWIGVLEQLALVSTTVWPLVKILAWQCLAMLKSIDE